MKKKKFYPLAINESLLFGTQKNSEINTRLRRTLDGNFASGQLQGEQEKKNKQKVIIPDLYTKYSFVS